MSTSVVEKEIFSNEFGTVTDRRVTYFRRKGWIRGGSREDVPIKHVTSVRVDITRHVIWGSLLLLSALGGLSSGDAGGILVAVLLGGLAVLLLWGSPTVVVNTAGRDLSAAKGLPWQRPAADGFAEALRSQLFRDEK